MTNNYSTIEITDKQSPDASALSEQIRLAFTPEQWSETKSVVAQSPQRIKETMRKRGIDENQFTIRPT